MSSGSDSRGFTLLEVTVALAVVGVLMVGALAAAAADLRASRKAVDTLEAAALAEDLLARTELLAPEALRLLADGEEGRIDPPLDRYRWRMEARPVAGEPGLMEVRVTLTWPGGSLPVTTRVRDRTKRLQESAR